MRVLLTGSHGLIGSALLAALVERGHQVVPLIRSRPGQGERQPWWDPAVGQIELTGCGLFDAVIHLAGENLASGRWTQERKARIRASRVDGTQLLCRALSLLSPVPPVLLSASATGFYGSRGDEVLTEESRAGTGFLADVCQQWEAATAPAAHAGTRVVRLRFGIILSKQGGALAKMLLPFRLGLGGRMGSGLQFWSWISLEDAVAAICHTLTFEQLAGPVNVVSPGPVTNREFARTLGEVLGRPAWLPAPATALRLALGQMADEALLASARVTPGKLVATGFRFQSGELRSALDREITPRPRADTESGR